MVLYSHLYCTLAIVYLYHMIWGLMFILQAALAAIIVVILKGLYLQMKDIKQLWIISKYDMV